MPGTIRPELARAWERYFGQRGGESPRPATEVIPVIQMDDAAAYPAFRRWYAGFFGVAPPAGEFDFHIITNNDPLGTGSVVVIDEVVGPGNFYWIGTTDPTTIATFTLTGTHIAADAAQEKEGGLFNPIVANVLYREMHSNGAIGQALAGFSDQYFRGPWTLAPQASFFVRMDVAAQQGGFYFRGRYYPGA